jgi:hypothetical protein
MDNFDLKKYLAENRLNEGVDSSQESVAEWLFNQFQRTGIYPKYSVDDEESNSKQDLIHTLIEKAKAKEIENIKNAFNYGQTDPGMEADEYLDFINFK